MGVVYRAWDLHLGRYVAVKILRGLAMDPAGRARFREEGQTLALLNHPGLITLLDAETEDGCVVMPGALAVVVEPLLSLEPLLPPQPCSASSAQPVSAAMPTQFQALFVSESP
jgi:serine/threonine protein kinase